jgi:WD40 repeat protein
MRAPAVQDSRSWGAWRPDGLRYVGYWCAHDPCSPGTATLLDSTTGEVVREQAIADHDVYGLAYIDGGRSLLVTTIEGTFVLNAESLQPRRDRVDAPGHDVIPIGDGTTAMLQEVSGDGTTVRWRVVDVTTGYVRSEGEMGLRATASVSSPDGSTVAVAANTGDMLTIDVSTGAERARAAGLGAKVLWLDYSNDGKRLVSGASDGGVSLWDATTLDRLGTVYPVHYGEPVAAGAHFIGDSHDVAIASYDGHVYRWETDLERAIQFACQMAGRTLTDKEWKEFLPEQPYRSVCPDL